MKKSIFSAALLFAFVFAGLPKTMQAQKYQGQVVIGANCAFSLVGLVMNTAFNVADRGIVGLSTSVTPGLSGTVDVGVTDRFSLGVSHFYQSANAHWSTYTDNNGITHTGDFHYRITRQNTALRALFHFGDNDDIDPYFGIRLGYSYWSSSSNIADVDQTFDLSKFKPHLWPQALFGVRYFFIPNLGVNAEIAAGPPYYLSVGLNARFGGTK
ncbi:MAG TPA: hypothetical protein VFU15_01200 [Bacteroidia bacterium]|nr:hypothetical protein [Bacteroidia bacterium]